MILVVTQHKRSEPRTNVRCTVMLPALKFSLDGFQLRDHPLLSRDPPDGECPRGELPTEMGEPKKSEGFWFSLATLFSVSSCKPRPNSISRVLSEFNSEPNFT